MHEGKNTVNPGKQFKFNVRSGTKHIPVFYSELALQVSKTVATPNLKKKKKPSHSLPGGSVSKESICNAGDLDLIAGLERSPGRRHDNPLQYSCMENPHGQRSLVGYSPWGGQESDTTE